MKHFLLGLFASTFLSAPLLSAATLNPVVTYSSATISGEDRAFTVGYEFQTSTTFNINALGYYNDGNGFSHAVGIWDSAGNLLVSTTVLPTDPLQSTFLWDSVSFTLTPGTYVIGGQLYENGKTALAPTQLQGVVTLPGYTWIEDRQIGGTGLNFPTTVIGGYGNNGILAVDFSVSSTPPPPPVPEPGSLVLLASGLLSIAGVLRRNARRA